MTRSSACVLLTFVLCAGLLIGAAGQRARYHPVPLEGQSPAQIDADDAACEVLAREAIADGMYSEEEEDTGEVTKYGAPIIAWDSRGYDAYRNCMFERGYRAAHEPPPPTPIERPVSDRPASWCNDSFDIWDPESETCRAKYPLRPGF